MASINSLEPDILFEIFKFTQHPFYHEVKATGRTLRDVININAYAFNNDWYLITHVCHLWRTIAFDKPCLWTYIDANANPSPRISLHLELSDKEPLFVVVEPSLVDGTGKKRLSATIPSARIIFKETPRIENLIIRNFHAMTESFWNYSLRFPTVMLKNLILEGSAEDEILSTIKNTLLANISLPLEGIKLTNIIPTEDVTCLKNLKSLSLRFDRFGSVEKFPALMKMDNLLSALEAFTKLEYLDIDIEADMEKQSKKEAISLPNLKWLRLKAYEHVGAPFFESFDLPRPFQDANMRDEPLEAEVIFESTKGLHVQGRRMNPPSDDIIQISWYDPHVAQTWSNSPIVHEHAVHSLRSIIMNAFTNLSALHLHSECFVQDATADHWNKLFKSIPTLTELSHDDNKSDGVVSRSSQRYNERIILDALGKLLDEVPPCPDLELITFYGVNASLQAGFYASLSAMLLERCCHQLPIRTLHLVEYSGISMDELDLLREYTFEVLLDNVRFGGIIILSENETPRIAVVE